MRRRKKGSDETEHLEKQKPYKYKLGLPLDENVMLRPDLAQETHLGMCLVLPAAQQPTE